MACQHGDAGCGAAAAGQDQDSSGAGSTVGGGRSSEEQQAIKDLIQEVEAMEKVKVVLAGYGISSRTMGTVHSGSDHDIKCIFVHPRCLDPVCFWAQRA